jgi:hypothetical protein
VPGITDATMNDVEERPGDLEQDRQERCQHDHEKDNGSSLRHLEALLG